MRILLIVIAVMSLSIAGCKGNEPSAGSKSGSKGASDKKSDNSTRSGAAVPTPSTPGDVGPTPPSPSVSGDSKSTESKPTLSSSGGPKPKNTAPTTDPVLESPDDHEADEADEADEACLTECVQRNQMRAVGPEVIDEDCRAECAKK